MILSKERDLRLVTIRRGGSLTDEHHHLLALWSAECAEHVLHLFEMEVSGDHRPVRAVNATCAWVDGRISMTKAREAGGHSMAAARGLTGAPRFAAYAAGQAACVAHLAAHDLGAAAYAIKAVMASVPESNATVAGRLECDWQRRQLPSEIRELVLDDQRLRNHLCWGVFDL